MKIFTAIIAALMIAGGTSALQAQLPDINGSNPGILLRATASVDDTALPTKAKKFIKNNFKFQRIAECQQETPSGNYEVTLGDGKEIEFDHNGNWIEVSAPDDMLLPRQVVERLLPRKAYKVVADDGYASQIDNVSRLKNGHYAVEVDEVLYDEIEFDVDGTLFAFHM